MVNISIPNREFIYGSCNYFEHGFPTLFTLILREFGYNISIDSVEGDGCYCSGISALRERWPFDMRTSWMFYKDKSGLYPISWKAHDLLDVFGEYEFYEAVHISNSLLIDHRITLTPVQGGGSRDGYS